MNMWVTHRLLNASFIFNRIEYATLDFNLCFYEFDLYASGRFWTLFFSKKVHFDLYVNRLIRKYILYTVFETVIKHSEINAISKFKSLRKMCEIYNHSFNQALIHQATKTCL